LSRRLAFVLLAVALAAPAAAAKTPLPGIRTPSGNISCFSVPGPPSVLQCQIRQSAYAGKLAASCGPRIGVDWAGFALGPRTKGSVSCSGGVLYSPDTQRPVFTTLDGLFISRESRRAW
jgi:hypothetical protein